MIYFYGRMGQDFREFAWRTSGKWIGGGKDPGLPIPAYTKKVSHTCDLAECGRFICIWCRNVVPLCNGGHAGDTAEAVEDKLCDDCWFERHRHAHRSSRAASL